MNFIIHRGSTGKTTMHRSVRRQWLAGLIAAMALFAQSAMAVCCGPFAHADVTSGDTHPADCPSLNQKPASSQQASTDGFSDELWGGDNCVHLAPALCIAHSLPPVSASYTAVVALSFDTGPDHLLLPRDTTLQVWSPGHGFLRSRAERVASPDGRTLFLTTRRLRL
ncbi:MAG: hypothetical protein JJU27_01190 [Gammaproteobacteria bacterium]|nr:hypothetical protein [Gammaproteobacteria bacterium]